MTGHDLRFGDALAAADLDGDLYSNLFEYVFAGDPGDPLAPAGPVLHAVPDGREFSFVGSAQLDDVSLRLLESQDLSRGPWTDSGIAPVVGPAGEGLSSYRFTIPFVPGVERAFYRIGASPTTPSAP